MKIAILTDIHGNAAALKAVINDIDQNDIDQIYCLGDMIAIGPDTNEVLELLFARKNMNMITGNHDEAVLAVFNGEPHPKSHAHVREHHEWIAKRIESTYIRLLGKLPRRLIKTIHQTNLYFTHYRILPDKMEAPISDDPFHTIVDPSLENMEQLFKYFSQDIICFGHHHPRHFFKGARTTYLNPGALGCNHQSIAPYAIINMNEDSSYQIHIKEIVYDRTAFLQSYMKLEVPEREFILKVFHGIGNV